MNTAHTDLWAPLGYDAIVITTNGFVKRSGEAVMGRGCARQAATQYPWLPLKLGSYLLTHGNRSFRFTLPDRREHLLSMPVKPTVGPNGEPGFSCNADITIIRSAAEQLVEMADKFGYDRIILPRPGCGNGHLSWSVVEPELSSILDDRFTAVTK